MELIRSLSALLAVFVGVTAFAHGEDRPGPHGGEIRMPGGFHTELVAVGPKRLRIYLLDIHLSRPSVADSSVEASFAGPEKVEARCRKEKDSFLCSFDGNVNLEKSGEITVVATREKQKGSAAKYKTPLGKK